MAISSSAVATACASTRLEPEAAVAGDPGDRAEPFPPLGRAAPPRSWTRRCGRSCRRPAARRAAGPRGAAPRARLLALDVHPAADPPVRVAVQSRTHCSSASSAASALGKKWCSTISGDHPRGDRPAAVGGVAAGDPPDPRSRPRGAVITRVVLRPHVEKAGGSAAKHLRRAQQHAHPLVLGDEMRIERHRPVEDPGARRRGCRGSCPRQRLREVDVGVDEPGRGTATRGVDDDVGGARREPEPTPHPRDRYRGPVPRRARAWRCEGRGSPRVRT